MRHLPCALAFPAGGKSLVADVLMLSRLHTTQQALLAKAGPHRGHKPQQPPVTRALIVLPYLSIGKHSRSRHMSAVQHSGAHMASAGTAAASHQSL
jgi:hypothetical protein